MIELSESTLSRRSSNSTICFIVILCGVSSENSNPVFKRWFYKSFSPKQYCPRPRQRVVVDVIPLSCLSLGKFVHPTLTQVPINLPFRKNFKTLPKMSAFYNPSFKVAKALAESSKLISTPFTASRKTRKLSFLAMAGNAQDPSPKYVSALYHLETQLEHF